MNEDFYDDSQIGLEVDGKRWAGRNYGFQSEESYNKLYVQGKLNPAQQAIERATSSIAGLPGIKQGLEFIGGATRFAYQQLPSPVQQAVEFGLAKNQEAAENIAAATGLPVALTDPTTIADVVTGGATLAVKPGLKKAVRETVEGAANLGRNLPPPGATPQLAMAGATAGPTISVKNGSINLSPTVMKLTVDDPRLVASGVKQGTWREFEDQLKRMDIRWAQSEKRLKSWVEKVDDPRRMKNIKKSRDALKGKASTGPSRIEDIADENWYTKDNKDFVDVINQTPQLGLERHHMFPKAESYIFVEHMRDLIRRGIADRDDMVNLFLYAEDAGAVMGNRKANMLLMEKIKQHGPHHRMRETTEGALGLVMEPANLQDLADVVKTANNATELMTLFDEYLIKNIKPSKQDAFNRVMGQSKAVLNEALKQKRMGSALSEAQRRRL